MSDFMQTTFFYLENFLKKLPDAQCPSITNISIKHTVQTTFYHSSGWTRNLMYYGSIYCVLYLQILCFYLVGQNYKVRQGSRESLMWKWKDVPILIVHCLSLVICCSDQSFPFITQVTNYLHNEASSQWQFVWNKSNQSILFKYTKKYKSD